MKNFVSECCDKGLIWTIDPQRGFIGYANTRFIKEYAICSKCHSPCNVKVKELKKK